MKKTFKRETAWVLLLALCGVFVWGHAFESPAVIETDRFLTSPIFLFAAGAFGLDAISKQVMGNQK